MLRGSFGFIQAGLPLGLQRLKLGVTGSAALFALPAGKLFGVHIISRVIHIDAFRHALGQLLRRHIRLIGSLHGQAVQRCFCIPAFPHIQADIRVAHARGAHGFNDRPTRGHKFLPGGPRSFQLGAHTHVIARLQIRRAGHVFRRAQLTQVNVIGDIHNISVALEPGVGRFVQLLLHPLLGGTAPRPGILQCHRHACRSQRCDNQQKTHEHGEKVIFQPHAFGCGRREDHLAAQRHQYQRRQLEQQKKIHIGEEQPHAQRRAYHYQRKAHGERAHPAHRARRLVHRHFRGRGIQSRRLLR